MRLTEYHRLGLYRLVHCLVHENNLQQPRSRSSFVWQKEARVRMEMKRLSGVFVLTQIAALCHQVHRDVSDGDG